MAPSERPSEKRLVKAGAEYLARQGYRTYIDPDHSDYFDLVARKGDEVGLVEAKIADARTVLAQALTRRVWGSWVAVLLYPPRRARSLEERTRERRGSPVGVWTWDGSAVEVLRPARSWVVEGREDPYAELRARFRQVLDALDRGDVPTGLAWDSVPGAVRRASNGRRFREWRLDEAGPDTPRSGGE